MVQKKALLIGCNYPNQARALPGPCRDTANLANLLVNQFGYNDVILLVDDPSLFQFDPEQGENESHSRAPQGSSSGGFMDRIRDKAKALLSRTSKAEEDMKRSNEGGTQLGINVPTKDIILQGIAWLVSGNSPGDKLFFAYSGHGGSLPDTSGTETDGFMECLCPTDDFLISDDLLNEVLVRNIQEGVLLHCHIDACHSGTILDLPFVSEGKAHDGKWKQVEDPKYKGSGGGTVVQFSSCTDAQVSADHGVESGGLGTQIFIQTITELEGTGSQYSYADVVDRMMLTSKLLKSVKETTSAHYGVTYKERAAKMADSALEKIHGGIGGKFLAKHAAKLRLFKQDQVPQISASSRIDMSAACIL